MFLWTGITLRKKSKKSAMTHEERISYCILALLVGFFGGLGAGLADNEALTVSLGYACIAGPALSVVMFFITED